MDIRQLYSLLLTLFEQNDELHRFLRLHDRPGMQGFVAGLPSPSTAPADYIFRVCERLEAYGYIDQGLFDQLIALRPGHKMKIEAVASSVLAEPTGGAVDAGRGAEEGEQYERVMGRQPTFLHVCFLETGLQRARAVAKLVMSFGGRTAMGTGFLIAPDLVLTNHHNLFERDGTPAESVRVLFDYEQDAGGRLREVVEAPVAAGSSVGEWQQAGDLVDWAVVRLIAGQADRTPLPLSSRAPAVEDWVAIVQHPGGMPKQIALHHNTVSYVDDNVVHYMTDTEAGSSGSPVFDDRWDVVALHHAGGRVTLPTTGRRVYSNRGVRISRVRERLAAHGLL